MSKEEEKQAADTAAKKAKLDKLRSDPRYGVLRDLIEAILEEKAVPEKHGEDDFWGGFPGF